MSKDGMWRGRYGECRSRPAAVPRGCKYAAALVLHCRRLASACICMYSMQVKIKDTSMHVLRYDFGFSSLRRDLPRLHRKPDRQSLFNQNDELLANYTSCMIYTTHVPKIHHKPISNPFTHRIVSSLPKKTMVQAIATCHLPCLPLHTAPRNTLVRDAGPGTIPL
jgi:hypothetical protein